MGKKQKLKQQRKIEKELAFQENKKKKKFFFWVVLIAIVGLLVGGYFVFKKPANTEPETSTNIEQSGLFATIKTARGDIKIQLFPDNAPQTVANFTKLAQEQFYNGTTFHRVVADFVIQGGDPLSKNDNPNDDGTGGPGYTFADEINPWSLGLSDQEINALEAQGYTYTKDVQSLPNTIGALAMANSGPGTNGSQFFIITQKDQPHLNGKHTVFGQVVEGLDIARQIQQGDKIETIEIKDGP